MQAALQQLTTLNADSQALMAVYDPDDRLVYANPAFRSAFFVGTDERPLWADLMRRNHALARGSRIDTADIDKWLTSTLSRRAKLTHRAFESDLLDGRWIWIVETTLANGWGSFVGTDITGLRADERSLRQARDLALRASQTDELTGISNRRHIMSVLEAMMAGQTSHQSGTGCISVLDVDHFKRLNDTYGHQTGDEVLVHIARTVRGTIRIMDSFGRLGGEEFMLVLPGFDLTEAQHAVEQVLRDLRESRPSTRHADIRLTCSAGLTDIRPTDTVQTLYARADGYLYEAKRTGRDRCVACPV